MKQSVGSVSALIALSATTAFAGIVAAPFANVALDLAGDVNIGIDVDGDGSSDFDLSYNRDNPGASLISGVGNNEVVVDGSLAGRYDLGAPVNLADPGAGAAGWTNLIGAGFSRVGVKFAVGGQTNLGWIQFKLPNSSTGYLARGAWEDVAGQSIPAGGVAGSVAPEVGPFAGGHQIVISNCTPAIGGGADITNILVGTAGTTNIIGQGTNWAAFIAPPAASPGVKDIVVQSESAGDSVLTGACKVCAMASNLPLGTVVYDDAWTWSGSPLNWRLVHTNYAGAPGSVTLMATNSIGSMPYIASGWQNRWPGASMRTYLNSNFYTNFSPAFAGIVMPTLVPWAIWNPHYADPSSGITTDRVFIASMTELGGTAFAGDGAVLGWFSGAGAAARRAAIGSWFWTKTGEQAEYGGIWYDMSAYYVRADTGAFVAGNWTSDSMATVPMLNIIASAQFEPMPDGRYRLASPMPQAISFPGIAPQKRTGSLGLAATTSSGLPVSFGVKSGPGAITGGTNLAFSAAGDVEVVAAQAGDACWQAAPEVTNIVQVRDPALGVLGTNGAMIASGEAPALAKGTDFGAIPWDDLLCHTFAVTNTGSVELDVSDVAIYGEGAAAFIYTPLLAGLPAGGISNLFIQFAPLAAETYTAAVHVVSDATTTPYIVYLQGTGARQQQAALSFTPATPQVCGTTSSLGASGGSGTGVFGYAVLSGPGEIVGSTNLLVTAGTGMVMVMATRAADDLYHAASITASVAAARAGQTIAFPAIPDQTLTGIVHLAATASSGLPVAFGVAGGPGVITGGSNLAFTSTGMVSVAASQSGNTNWNAAPNITNAFMVLPAPVQAGWLVINVAPEQGSWSLVAPAGYTGPTSGTGSLAAQSAVTGLYSVAWGPLSGYVTPGGQAQFVLAGSTALFSAVYLQISTNIGTPSGVSASAGTYTNKIRITWIGVPGATGYEVWRSQTNDPNTAVRIADIPLAMLKLLPSAFSLLPSYYYDDYNISPVQSYYYWVRAKTSSLISPLSYVGLGYAALPPEQAEGSADIGVSDFVFLPVNVTNMSHPGTLSCWIRNYGPGSLAGSAVRMDLYLTNDSIAAWIGGAQTNLTLSVGEEKVVIVARADKQGMPVRGDLSGACRPEIRVRHLAALDDPNPANNICPAAGWVRIKSAGANSPARSSNDYDGDGRADGALCSTNMLVWAVLCSGTRYRDCVVVETGQTRWDAAPGDYEGCGQTCAGVYVPSLGYWYVWFPAAGQGHAFVLGGPGYVAAPCDFDGDAKTDPVVYRAADGWWFGASSAEGYALKEAPGMWAGYVPVPGDYDGDAKADPAAYYNERTGAWIIGPSSAGYAMLTGVFGGPGWITVSADYDGDGRTDPAVYNSAAGCWQMLLSGSLETTGQYTWQGGLLGDMNGLPVPADYDGDGKADPAVYHQGTGAWQLFLSTRAYGEFGGGFGGPEYRPVQE